MRRHEAERPRSRLGETPLPTPSKRSRRSGLAINSGLLLWQALVCVATDWSVTDRLPWERPC